MLWRASGERQPAVGSEVGRRERRRGAVLLWVDRDRKPGELRMRSQAKEAGPTSALPGPPIPHKTHPFSSIPPTLLACRTQLEP